MKKLLGVCTILTMVGYLLSCTKVPISGRKQVNLLPESEMMAMSFAAYTDFLTQNKVIGDRDPRAQLVKNVGEKIKVATETYLTDHGQSKRVEGFQWEFNLVDDPAVNAWCMPGGKVVVYTGILPVTQDEASLGVVLGHEIAHAIARHGNERMSQALLIQAGGITLSALMQEKPEQAQNLFLTSYGVGSTLGALAFSRQHESEADKLGLVFMAIAGYDPGTAVGFWERMSAGGGMSPPEILSTHPSDETRIADIKEFLPEAMKYYKP